MKKCVTCKKKFEPWNSLQKACSPACALKVAKKDIAQKEKKQKQVNKVRKEALKTVGELKKEAQTAFNRFIRLRDHNDGCISCGKTKAEVESKGSFVGGYWDAGHYMTRGARPELRFVENNVHKQCKICNGGSGRFSAKEKTVSQQYRENLIKKIGIDAVKELESYHEPVKWLPDQLREIKNTYNAKANQLKKELGIK